MDGLSAGEVASDISATDADKTTDIDAAPDPAVIDEPIVVSRRTNNRINASTGQPEIVDLTKEDSVIECDDDDSDHEQPEIVAVNISVPNLSRRHISIDNPFFEACMMLRPPQQRRRQQRRPRMQTRQRNRLPVIHDRDEITIERQSSNSSVSGASTIEPLEELALDYEEKARKRRAILNQNENAQSTRTEQPPPPPPPQNELKCPICIDTFAVIKSRGVKTVVTRCGHIFCDLCLKTAINQNGRTCPKCRLKIPRGPTGFIEIFDVC